MAKRKKRFEWAALKRADSAALRSETGPTDAEKTPIASTRDTDAQDGAGANDGGTHGGAGLDDGTTADEQEMRERERGGAVASEELDPSLPLRVNDLKQYAYCPRVVFYQYAMPVDRKATFKMEHGKTVELRIAQLEKRRGLRQYGLGGGERRFNLHLHSPRLGLSGRLDLLIVTAQAAFPVDFKDTLEPVRQNHRVQLCAYALLVEEVLCLPVPIAFIYRVPRDDVTATEMTPALRSHTFALMSEIREMIRRERMPPPTEVRERCTDCEYRNYCGDVS